MKLGSSLAFIPRLVVHKEEVQRIFHPTQRPRRSQYSRELDIEHDENASQSTTIEVARNGSIFLRGLVPDLATLKSTIRKVTSDVPEHMRTAPIVITKLAKELPSRLSALAIELPSRFLLGVPTTIISVAEGVEGQVENLIEITRGAAKEIVELPHRASFEWRQLIWVLSLLVFAPVLIFGLVFFIPLNSVNEGAEKNRTFIYGTMTFYQVLIMIPWVETCNFAMPGADIPVRARVVTLLVAMTVAKTVDVICTEGWLGRVIFPMPFSILFTGMIGVLTVVPLLYWMSPNREKVGFRRMQTLLFAYWLSLLIVISWAVGVQRLMGHPIWQSVLTFMYGPLRFVCKILVSAPITVNHNPYRWIQLNIVVDILFTRVQVATFPFIDSYITLLMLFSTEVLTLVWRYYNGSDRLALWWHAVSNVTLSRDKECPESSSLGRKMTTITKSCFRAPIPDIALMNLNLNQKNARPDIIIRTLTGETDLTIEGLPVALSSSKTSSDGSEHAYAMDDVSSLGEGSGSGVVIDIESACQIIDNSAPLGPCRNREQNVGPASSVVDSETGSPVRARKSTSILSGDVELPCTGDEYKTKRMNLPFPEEAPEDPRHEIPVSVLSENNDVSDPSAPDDGGQSSMLTEASREDWEQRPLFHVVDSTGANVISIIVRINQQLSMYLVRNLPSQNHLNESFQISDERWFKAQIYGWAFVVLMLILLAILGFTFFRRLQKLDGKKLTLSRVMSYLFKDHFWFFFFWLLATGAFVCASMVNHFGADFSFDFEWISCEAEMAWPGCPV